MSKLHRLSISHTRFIRFVRQIICKTLLKIEFAHELLPDRLELIFAYKVVRISIEWCKRQSNNLTFKWLFLVSRVSRSDSRKVPSSFTTSESEVGFRLLLREDFRTTDIDSKTCVFVRCRRCPSNR